MNHLPKSAIPLLLSAVCSSCAANSSPDAKAPTETKSHMGEPAPAEKPKASTVRVVTREHAGRSLEILNESGTVLATFLPEDFTQRLLVPDIANNSSELIALDVTGTDVLTASIEPASGKVLVGVRGFLYAETSTDLVFILELGEGEDVKAKATMLPVYFDGANPTREERAPRPHLDIARVSFGSLGTLELETADASGGAAKLTYDANRTPVSCSWQGGESRRCPTGLSSK